MSVNVQFAGNTYPIPNAAGESGWTGLTDYLVALANNAATSGALKQAIRVATSTPVTIAVTDSTVVTDLTVAGAVAIALPTGVTKQIFIVVDGKGDAATNNLTVSATGGQLINGAATFVLNANYQGVILQFDGTQWRVLVSAKTNAAGSIVNADVNANAAIALTKLASVPNGEVLMGNGSNKVASYTVGGDVAIGAGGVSAITPGVIVDADVNASAAIAGTKLGNTPSGNLAATTVQGALNELQTDVDTRATSAALTAHISASSTHGVSGAIVGTTDTQALTNKTFNDTSNVILKGGNTGVAFLRLGTTDAANVEMQTNGSTRFLVAQTADLIFYDGAWFGTGGVLVSSGTTAQRPASAGNATFRYNSTLVAFEGRINGTWRPFATQDGTETLTNKTLTSPSLNTPLQGSYEDWTHSTAPSAPGASKLRVYVKSDNKVYIQTPAGVETALLRVGDAGGGDVVGPASATSGRVAVYNGATGKILQDGTKLETDLATGPASATSGNVPSFNGTGGKILQDSGKLAADIVTGPASATANGIARYNSTTGKIIKDSIVTISDTGTLSAVTSDTASHAVQNASTGNHALVARGGSSASARMLQLRGGTGASTAFFIQCNNDANTVDYFTVRGDGLLTLPGYVSATFTTGNAANAYIVPATGEVNRSTSSKKYKKNIKDYSRGIEDLMKLRAVSYQSKNPREKGQTFAGFIAEEVEETGLTEFVQYAADGSPDALGYSNMVALCVKCIQEQHTRILKLEERLRSKETA